MILNQVWNDKSKIGGILGGEYFDDPESSSGWRGLFFCEKIFWWFSSQVKNSIVKSQSQIKWN